MREVEIRAVCIIFAGLKPGRNSQVSWDDLLHGGKSGQFVLTNNRKIEAFTIHSNLAEGGQKTFQVFLNQGFVIDNLKILIERETWMNPIDWI